MKFEFLARTSGGIIVPPAPPDPPPGGGGLPAGWNATDFDPAAILFADTWETYVDTPAVQAGVGASFGSGGSASGALSKVNNDPVFPNAAIMITQIYNDNDPAASGASPEIRRSFGAVDAIWVRHGFRFVGTAHPDFAAAADWTPAGAFPVGHADSYKMDFITWQGASQRLEVEWSNAANLLLGLGMSSVTSRLEQNLVTLFGQPAGTALFPPNGAAPAGMKTGAQWWERLSYFKKLSATHCVARFWLRQLSTGAVPVYNPQPWYFNGLDWSNCVGTIALANGIAIGANRNKTAPDDGISAVIYPAQPAPQKGLHIIRGPVIALNANIEADPFGVAAHGGGPY